MNHYRSFTAEDAVRAAASALSRSAGETVRLEDVRDLGGAERRNLILRALAVGPGGAARSVVVKATRAAGYDPDAANIYQTSGLVKEWAASTLLARQTKVPDRRGSLLAADLALGVLIFDDHGEALASLVKPLLEGSAEQAERALTAYAIALAQLHAATTGCLEAHRHIVRAALPSAAMRPPGQGWIDREPRKVAALLGGDLPDDELMLMETRLQSPGPWLALVHGDACPDNILLAEDGEAKLIDFEFSSPGHALIDAAYWRMGFPTCWCAGRIPAAVSQRIDAAYRAALAHAVPEAADRSAFQKESAIIGAVWMFGVLAWLLEGALKEDTNWGIATKRSRILHYLDAAIEMSTAAGVLHGTCRTAGVWLDDLRDRWPLSAPLALYPAFEKPGDEG